MVAKSIGMSLKKNIRVSVCMTRVYGPSIVPSSHLSAHIIRQTFLFRFMTGCSNIQSIFIVKADVGQRSNQFRPCMSTGKYSFSPSLEYAKIYTENTHTHTHKSKTHIIFIYIFYSFDSMS